MPITYDELHGYTSPLTLAELQKLVNDRATDTMNDLVLEIAKLPDKQLEQAHEIIGQLIQARVSAEMERWDPNY